MLHKNIKKMIDFHKNDCKFAAGQVLHNQLPLNPPGRERSKGIRL